MILEACVMNEFYAFYTKRIDIVITLMYNDCCIDG